MKKMSMGWLPDYPDHRDFTLDHDDVKPMVEKLGFSSNQIKSLPPTRDLRKWCSPVEDQGPIGSCTAQAGVGLLEYYQRKAFGEHLNGSRLFLYKATRNLLQWTGDTGAFLRTTMGAMVLFGVAPEKYWPYNPEDYDLEPNAFCYSFAKNYEAIRYFRLDPPGTAKDKLLNKIKELIAFGLPSMFGFTVYNSISQARNTGKIPFPCTGESVEGGHAVVAVGYDDDLEIENDFCNHKTKGAFLIRNSWGTGWGDNGYGWLPYDFVLEGLAIDWWTLFKADYIDTDNFSIAASSS